MAKFKNVSPLGALDLPLVGRVVDAGEVLEVTAAQAKHLKGQTDWQPVKAGAGDESGAQGAANDQQSEE